MEKFRETRNLVGKREILAGPWKQDLKWDDVEQSKHRFQVYDTLSIRIIRGWIFIKIVTISFFFFLFPFLYKFFFERIFLDETI